MQRRMLILASLFFLSSNLCQGLIPLKTALAEHFRAGNVIQRDPDSRDAAIDEETSGHISHVDVARERGDDSHDEDYIQATPRRQSSGQSGAGTVRICIDCLLLSTSCSCKQPRLSRRARTLQPLLSLTVHPSSSVTRNDSALSSDLCQDKPLALARSHQLHPLLQRHRLRPPRFLLTHISRVFHQRLSISCALLRFCRTWYAYSTVTSIPSHQLVRPLTALRHCHPVSHRPHPSSTQPPRSVEALLFLTRTNSPVRRKPGTMLHAQSMAITGAMQPSPKSCALRHVHWQSTSPLRSPFRAKVHVRSLSRTSTSSRSRSVV